MKPIFQKILIANRGEIACRIMRTAHKMGIATVAVISDADQNCAHARMADEVVNIGPAQAALSYLNIDAIVKAALETGAQAIHPGYGFLSENPSFVEAVEAAGLVFIGPSTSAMKAMGLKDAAKRLMEEAGVPVVPGYHGEAQELVVLAMKAKAIGYPVLIKARAGGGGKGMRKVENPEEFAQALSSAKREAKASFGDDCVLVEKYISAPRHIEVQVFGDNHGNVVHLYERDCSLQRRHQKVIEEAPAPGMNEATRQAMCEAAVRAAKAINYSGAGTIEFIVDGQDGLKPDGFWFMEMNTRLQVEHPVTEEITGLDLVEWQLRVASGEVLPLLQEQISYSGHAVEARIYAEDPAKGFLPAIGTLHHLRFPSQAPTGTRLRFDSGVEEGDTISPYYDPMIAKAVVHADNRTNALENLADALEHTQIAGSTANTGFLACLLRQPDFINGAFDTGLIDREQENLIHPPELSDLMIAQAALAASGLRRPNGQDPWDSIGNYGHFTSLAIHVDIEHDGQAYSLSIQPISAERATITNSAGQSITLAYPCLDVGIWPAHISLFDAGYTVSFKLSAGDGDGAQAGSANHIIAPMPGLVKITHVAVGDSVQKGQPLLILEAMKMEHSIVAPRDCVIEDIVQTGQQISDGTPLVQFEQSPS